MKTWIVAKSEFFRRVRTRWFVATTVLAPVFFLGLILVPPVIGYMATRGDVRTVVVADETGVLGDQLIATQDDRLRFVLSDGTIDEIRAAVHTGDLDGYLLLPAELVRGEGTATYYSVQGGGLTLQSHLEHVLDAVVHEWRLAHQNAPPEILEIVRSKTPVRLIRMTESGETADATAASSVLGLIMGFVMYLAMFLYGAYVMHGVMEEKQSRVLEVIVSSVRPFQLLMGKVLGIGAVGLVQMGAWLLFLVALSVSAGSVISLFLDPSDFGLPEGAASQDVLAAADVTLPALSPGLVFWFLLFFLGGYVLYASLFAAIGAAVENQQDAQGLMLPVSLLIIIPILFIAVIVESPNTTLATTLSIIPFFSPILMIVRIAITSVPLWQILLALVLLCVTFVGSIWASGRIYRVGILMYGKKPTIRDLLRWVRYA